MKRSPLAQARLTIVVALSFALVGSLFGVTLIVIMGAGDGVDVWLIASCVLFSSAVLIRLVMTPTSPNAWVPQLACIYFLAYLTIGAVLAGLSIGVTGSFSIYLLWFFVLFVVPHVFLVFAAALFLSLPLVFLVPEHRGRW